LWNTERAAQLQERLSSIEKEHDNNARKLQTLERNQDTDYSKAENMEVELRELRANFDQLERSTGETARKLQLTEDDLEKAEGWLWIRACWYGYEGCRRHRTCWIE
jgi:chromosome segregation ATPase